MLKASKAQMHIFIRAVFTTLWSTWSHIFLSLLPANPSLCIINIRNSVNEVSSFFFEILCTPCCIFKKYKQAQLTESVVTFFKWKLECRTLGTSTWENIYISLHNVPMFFFYVLYQKKNNSMQRNVSKLFLLDDKRTSLVRTAASFVLWCCIM